MGTAHLLKEMMVIRLDGGARQPQNEETTMLNTTDKIIKNKTGLLNLAEELGNMGIGGITPAMKLKLAA